MNTFLTNIEFARAAAKAFGLGNVSRAEVNTSDFDAPFTITFEIPISGSDLVRIGQLMAGDAAQAEPQHSWSIDGKPLTEALAQREVQHIDLPEEEPAGIPPHVWLYRNMLTDLQALAPLGRDETNGQYAVAIDDLTDEQRAIPHVAKQLCELARQAVEAGGGTRTLRPSYPADAADFDSKPLQPGA